MTGEKNAKTPAAKKAPAKAAAAKKAARPSPVARTGDVEAAIGEKIAKMPAPYRAMGERLHALITEAVPELTPRIWYGMPAYAKNGKTVCFFRVDKYMTFGFSEDANLSPEEGVASPLVASSYRIVTPDEATIARLVAIVRKAAR
jgi:hypothetical protein